MTGARAPPALSCAKPTQSINGRNEHPEIALSAAHLLICLPPPSSSVPRAPPTSKATLSRSQPRPRPIAWRKPTTPMMNRDILPLPSPAVTTQHVAAPWSCPRQPDHGQPLAQYQQQLYPQPHQLVRHGRGVSEDSIRLGTPPRTATTPPMWALMPRRPALPQPAASRIA